MPLTLNPSPTHVQYPDVIVIGSGIMSANLSVLLKQLDPGMSIQLYETTDGLAQESSHGWNNAGTGHAGLCELSYTPHRDPDGTVNVSKAIEIFEQFERSRQFWSYAVTSGIIDTPTEFIRPVPHLSFVQSEEQVEYLKARYEAMSSHHFFRGMDFTTDREMIASWAPLLIGGRDQTPIAATRVNQGTDVNFGNVARKLLGWLGKQPGCGIATGHKVTGLERSVRGWDVSVVELATGAVKRNSSRFVFVGAGGGSLRLLQLSGIPESRGLGGFPIGGQWLVCDNPAIVAQHNAKVYGQALGAAPTMAVPHLDTRILDGKKTLLFGPFAAWTTKFLHNQGSWMDLPRSVNAGNLATLMRIGVSNLDLIRYLVDQGTQSKLDRMKVLKEFYPEAQPDDWKLIDAGIRVQAIKQSDGRAGIVHYGTEIVSSSDRSIAALLGASPGASVSVSIALDVLKLCRPGLLEADFGRTRLKEMVPCFGIDIKHEQNAELFTQMRAVTDRGLGL